MITSFVTCHNLPARILASLTIELALPSFAVLLHLLTPYNYEDIEDVAIIMNRVFSLDMNSNNVSNIYVHEMTG